MKLNKLKRKTFMELKKVKGEASWQFHKRNINFLEEKENILDTNRQYLSNFSFDEEPLVSIIIPNRNGTKYLKTLFKDFDLKTNYSNYELIIVDNASSDDSLEYLNSLDMDFKIIANNENVSFSKTNNEGVEIANGEYILFLNNDIEPTYGWLNEMMGTIIYNENVGAVGAKLIYPIMEEEGKERYSLSIQHYGGIFREHVCKDFDYAARHPYKFSKDIFSERFLNNKKCIIATAAVLLMRKDTFLKLNRFDEDYWYGFEDVDLNLKLYQNGYDVLIASAALLLHYESVTRKKETRENYVLLNDKWGDFLFKELLHDKLLKKYFMTDKKLRFLFISKGFKIDQKLSKEINNAVSYLHSKEYEADTSKSSNLNIYRDVDVLVCPSMDYDIENINARNNIIKILILGQEDIDRDKCLNYDIIISEEGHDKDSLNLPNLYHINNLDNLGEKLISLLYNHYFDE